MDKQKGSFALIKQFMALEADGIIATHDLLLGTLIDLFRRISATSASRRISPTMS